MFQRRREVPLGTCVWYYIKRGAFLISSIKTLTHVEDRMAQNLFEEENGISRTGLSQLC